jgi:hypothetical protein
MLRPYITKTRFLENAIAFYPFLSATRRGEAFRYEIFEFKQQFICRNASPLHNKNTVSGKPRSPLIFFSPQPGGAKHSGMKFLRSTIECRNASPLHNKNPVSKNRRSPPIFFSPQPGGAKHSGMKFLLSTIECRNASPLHNKNPVSGKPRSPSIPFSRQPGAILPPQRGAIAPKYLLK